MEKCFGYFVFVLFFIVSDLYGAPQGGRLSIPNAAGLQADFAETIEKTMPSVVLITAQKRVNNYYDFSAQEAPSGQGSGFFIRANGYILTNFHVVRNQDTFWVTTHDGSEYQAVLAGADPATDLAILKINSPKKFPALKFADPVKVKIGHWAIAIGAPFSLRRTVTVGIVSHIGRSGVGVNLHENYIQTDASINPGNSGGPLLNIYGEVIGVNDFIMSPSGGNIGLSFAIACDIAGKISGELVKNGYIERPWLGVVIEDIDRETRRRNGLPNGIFISNLYQDSPAENILHPGDVILEADNEKIDAAGQFRSKILSLKPDCNLVLKVWRNASVRKITVRLRKSPRNWVQYQTNANGKAKMVNLPLVEI